MEPQDLASFVISLKGAPLSILVVMASLDRPTGPNELADYTGYAACTVRTGLRGLALLGLARRHTRYQGWVLTPQAEAWARRLGWQSAGPDPEEGTVPLADPEPDAVDAGGEAPTAGPPSGPDRERENSALDREKMPVPPCSSSYSHGSSLLSIACKDTKLRPHEQPTTTCGGDGKNLPLPARRPADSTPPAGRECAGADSEVEAAVEALHACGCPVRTRNGRGARDAVERALAHGWTGAEVLQAVRGWLAYAGTPAGRTIKHKGFFTMSRLRRGEPAPILQAAPIPQAAPALQAEVPASVQSAADRDAQARAYIEAQYERIVRR